VTDALHGVLADPSYVTLAGQVTVVVDDALAIEKVLESLLPLWFASPAKVALADAVPAPVLSE
jgi:hypothetical protein